MTWGLLGIEMNPTLRSFACFGPFCQQEKHRAHPCLSVLQTLVCLLGAPNVAKINVTSWVLLWKWGDCTQGLVIPNCWWFRTSWCSFTGVGGWGWVPSQHHCLLCTAHALEFSAETSSSPVYAAPVTQTPFEDPGETRAPLVLHSVYASYRMISVSRNSKFKLRQDCSERCHENWQQRERRMGNRKLATVSSFL